MSGWNFMHSPAADALARTLIYSLWEGTAVALALELVLCVLRSSRSRYAAACLAMLMILSALAVTFGRQLPSTEGLRLGAGLRSAVPALTSPHPVRMWPQITTPTTASQSELLFWVAPIWMAGVLLFWLRGVTNWLAVRRLRFAGTCAVPDLWLSRFGNLRNRLTLTRPVALLESSLADVPVVIGYLRPVILMPVGLLSALPVVQVEAILLHELAHVRRYDYLVNLAQVAIEGLLFYHPAVWWISGVMRSERENCCDDLVVATTGAAHEYASALTALERNRSPLGEALAATDGNLVYRVQRILGKRVRRQGAPMPTLIPAMAAFMAVTAMAAVLLGTDARATGHKLDAVRAKVDFATREPGSGGETSFAVARASRMRPTLIAQVTQPSSTSPQNVPPLNRQQYEELMRQRQAPVNQVMVIAMADIDQQRWLQDVVYIISAEEKRAFQQLHATAEREKFIEQFWLRRDPTPGTPENEFRDEYYRRLAFTNEHFGTASLEGWKSDRGRFYILYGPPDELDPHPSGGSYRRPLEEGGAMVTGFPVEYWRYRAIPALGDNVSIEFADPAMTGEFHLVMKPEDKDALLGPAPPRAPAQSNIRFTQPAQEAK